MSHPERIVPDETSSGIVAIHVKRYEFAEPLCRERDVLDAACGVGYGSALLGRSARRVVGVDVDAATVEYARARYAAANVEFRVGDVARLDDPDRSFDVVCSFETIEHVEDAGRFLDEVVRVLRDDGLLVVSTPNAPETTRTPENPYHRVEWARDDFERLLRGHFDAVELYGQRRLQTTRHRLAQRLDVLGLRRRLPALRRASGLLGTAAMAEVTSDGLVIAQDRIETATELVAVCRRPRRA